MVAPRGTPSDQARALAREALANWRGAHPDRAIEACDHALTLLLPVGPSDALADVLRWKGSIFRDRGNLGGATELYGQSLTVADSIDYVQGRAHALNCLGTVSQFRGDLASAERSYGQAARLAHRLGDRRLSGMVQQNLGIVADVQGRTDEAIAHFRLALAAFEQENQHDAALLVLNNLGVLYTREGAHLRAADILARALELARSLGDIVSEGVVEENRAILLCSIGQLEEAQSAAVRAYGIAEQRNDNTRRASGLRALAKVARVRDRSSQHAISLLDRALTLCELGEDALLRVEILSDLGDACHDCNQVGRGREHWRRALDLARLTGFAGLVGELQGRLRQAPTERGDDAPEATAS